ncbi:MAG TPA: Trp biosynthesis-associated membrane protein [Streptosporangiaceae bacterium]|nr:Trp biosynthesis-associated membrane protein [Streptosporangiaceae bacterium]
MSGGNPARQFVLVLVVCAAGAGLIVLAVRPAWAHGVFTAPHPLPAQDIAVSGQQLVPLASALALAALACLAAVIATRSLARRVAGVLLAILGAGAAAAAAAPVTASAVLAAARAQAASGAPGGSTTGGTSSGSTAHVLILTGAAGHAVMTGTPWRAVAVCGAVAVVLAGLATAWRGPRWPVMSTRFERERTVSASASASADSATIWESLSRDLDPTVEDGTDRQDLSGDRTPG